MSTDRVNQSGALGLTPRRRRRLAIRYQSVLADLVTRCIGAGQRLGEVAGADLDHRDVQTRLAEVTRAVTVGDPLAVADADLVAPLGRDRIQFVRVRANVVISALAKDSAVREALRTTTDDIVTPWYISVEIDAHHSDIRHKSGLSPEAFEALIEELWPYIEVVPRKRIVPHLQDAARAMHAYDPDDTLYVAAALAVDGTVVSKRSCVSPPSCVTKKRACPD